MKTEHFREQGAVIILADEHIRVRSFSQAGTAGKVSRSDFTAVQIQLDFALVPIEHGIYIRPFIFGQFIAFRRPKLFPVPSFQSDLEGPGAVTEHAEQITLLAIHVVAVHKGGQFPPFPPFIGARCYPYSDA
ncbi:hypothetical protein D3C75_602330 [compost metagenome]